MFAWWGHVVVRLRWLVLAVAAGVLVLGATWGGGVFGDLISGGFDDPRSPSSKAHREITAQLGRQDVDIIALYSELEGTARTTAAGQAGGVGLDELSAAQIEAQRVAQGLEGRAEIVTVMPGPV